MTIEQTLKDLSTFTWTTIAGTIPLGTVIREDGLTAMNLAVAGQREPDLSITLYPAQTVEREYGADFSWTSSNSDTVFLAQAKKLDPVSLKYTGFDPEQTDTLIEAAKNLATLFGTKVAPVYVFYNYVAGSDSSPEDWGCTFADATVVQEIVGTSRTKSFDALKGIQSPWYRMFAPDGRVQIGRSRCPRSSAPQPSDTKQIVIDPSELPTRVIIGKKW